MPDFVYHYSSKARVCFSVVISNVTVVEWHLKRSPDVYVVDKPNKHPTPHAYAGCLFHILP